ncbi:hypothetical protein Goklo_024809, partial [Gossypium klotzschianum]|nr:hypothetical protein [Gossypium klotzschianum]
MGIWLGRVTQVSILTQAWAQAGTRPWAQAVKEDSDLATIGGILRDTYSRWILGFNQFAGICSILNAELWGNLEGLMIVMDMGFDKVFILSDNQEVVQAIQRSAPKVSNSAL